MVDSLMGYKIMIDQETQELELDRLNGSTGDEYLVRLKDGNRIINFAVLRRERDRIILSVDGKLYSIVQLGKTRSSVIFIANGKTIEAKRAVDSAYKDGLTLRATIKDLIVSNFPAKVVKLDVKPGDFLRQGETLMVLEAMKMEAQIKAPRDCTVESIFVKEGEMIERGKPMIKLNFR
jgi:biotin carboxyl carrier protein